MHRTKSRIVVVDADCASFPVTMPMRSRKSWKREKIDARRAYAQLDINVRGVSSIGSTPGNHANLDLIDGIVIGQGVRDGYSLLVTVQRHNGETYWCEIQGPAAALLGAAGAEGKTIAVYGQIDYRNRPDFIVSSEIFVLR